ncbi:ABC transporter ATP-binding protein [Embleya sp. AB8]|uniref:ABC transporter ATP-binding protein n=1 Tax=Embleya sp. AB8 TaxID=3156304 RepID=UPI003C722CA5
MSADIAVHLAGLRRVFGPRAVLDGVDLDIARGEFVALLGASGTGKTTLLRILGALDRCDGGMVLVPEARTIVFQEPRLVPSKRVLANVVVGLPRGRATREIGLRALTEVGLEGHAQAWPATLSGGEAQRVALARALVREPELLLLDEPFAALDALTRMRMQDLVGELCRVHRPAVLLVTHDVEEAIRLADRVAVLRDGNLVTDEIVAVDRPRDPTDPAFAALRRRLLADLGVRTPEPQASAEVSAAPGASVDSVPCVSPASPASSASPASPAPSVTVSSSSGVI